MDHFFDVDDIGSLELALARAQMIKAHPRKGFIEGQGKSIGLLFSTQVYERVLAPREPHKI